MTGDTRSWPVGLRRLAEIVGPAAAVNLAESFGGIERVYIPKTARIDHPFVAVIGLDRMEALCQAFGGKHIDIPRGVYRDLKKAQIIEADGSHRQVALRLGCTQRYVRRVRSDLNDETPDSRQDDSPDLFD